MKLTVGARSDVGLLRDANEDAYLIQAPLFGVADGMGGHLAGDVASATAVEVIAKGIQDRDALTPESLRPLLQEANGAIWQKAHADSRLHGMGTTCTLIFVKDTTAHLAHVGDSRAYRFRDGSLEQLTHDHTLVARMVREGRIAAEDAERHPQRNVITRALGVDAEVEVDLSSVSLQEGDRLLICSDGLSSMVDRTVIEEVLAEERDTQRAADGLVEAANEAGGEDNITVIVLDVGAGEGVEASAVAEGRDQPEASADAPRRRGPAIRRPRRAVWAIALLVALALAYLALRYSLDHSWFVGLNEAGFVTIYSGYPEDVAGITLREERRETQLHVKDLPEFKRDDVELGIRTDSLEAAESAVSGLADLARDPEFRMQGES